jgi:hypothetical protein
MVSSKDPAYTALINALMHTKGYSAPETRAAIERAHLLIEQADAVGEPIEDPLLLFLGSLWLLGPELSGL